MSDFLLELLCEEIPARMQDKASADLARLFAEETAKAGLAIQAEQVWATPRRLALIARGLPAATAAVAEETKGPKTSAPDQAIDGFLRKTGLTRDQLVERDGTYFAVVERPGRATAQVLAEAISAIIRAFPWPKSMRWGAASIDSGSLRWVRPLSGIVALLGDDVVPFEIAGIASGAATVGHRFHHPGIVTIGNADDYAAKLRACHVIIDPEERRQIIRDRAAALAADVGLSVVPDEGLVVENAGLTEWPVPLLGDFDPAYLDVPREVIQLTMRTNQKYFALTRGHDGPLAPNFICVANIDASDGGASIAAGNRKVLAARLSDARFFWEQDLKIPLADQAKRLDQIVFHEKLGTIADKVERVAVLARSLAQQGIVDASPDQVEQAARLAKADLVTGMVGEFPELQGVMGGHIARAQGVSGPVADAIRDHYGTPEAAVSVAVALADKLDILKQFFAIDERPTGSKDPFALRRAAIQSVAIILRGLRFDLGQFVPRDVIDFIIDRWMVQSRSAGGRPDLIAAVVAESNDGDLLRLNQRMEALASFIGTDDGANLLTGYRRAANILKKEGWDSVDSSLSYQPQPEEAALLTALERAEPEAERAIAAEDFAGAMAALAKLRAPIDAFFDKVTVNDADPAKRAARLGMLARVRNAVHRVADFSRIEG